MDTSDTEPQDVSPIASRSWRRHSAEFKARVIELARQPGTSMAAVALANGLNANMLRRWVHEAAASDGVSKAATPRVPRAAPALASFVQLPMCGPAHHAAPDAQPTPPAPLAEPRPADITVEIHRGGTTVHAKLPLDERSAAWLREVLA